MKKTIKSFLRLSAPVLVLLLTAGWLSAQTAAEASGAAGLASQSLRPYWHVFIAYAIVIVMVLGWVISIARRLARLESRLLD
jgi:CcmD family protein